jgi:2'-5' RNA ligase
MFAAGPPRCRSGTDAGFANGVTYVLTLRFDAVSQQHFEGMRQRYFPPERNLVPAHLTLFHTLPAIDEIASTLMDTAATTRAFSLAVTGLRSLGGGVTYVLAAPEVQSLHRELSRSFAPHLTLQDQHAFQPHVVIQNKTTGKQAKALLVLLQADFQTFRVEAEGFDLWHYRNGPWELARQFTFRG